MEKMITLYKAWIDHTADTKFNDPEATEAENAEVWLYESGAYFGQYDDHEALAEALVDDSGMIADFWEGKANHTLASYFKFDYEQYGRDLDFSGDLWSMDVDGETHWFWSNY